MMGLMDGMGRMAAVVAVVGGLVLGTGTATRAEDNQFARDFGLGLGATGANLLYMPTKIVYATLGGITGGFAYGLTGGNIEAARKVWIPSMGGTYVVTPAMLQLEEKVMFSGTTEPRPTEVASSGQQRLAPHRVESAPPIIEEGSNEPFKGY